VVVEGFTLYPDAADPAPLTLSPDSIPHLGQQLTHLGFKKPQIRDATKFLSEESVLTFNLLNTLSPLEAAIEYLILHLPECDLPQRFLPSSNSSNPFITAAHSGNTDLKRRWIEEKAVKEAGWPPNAVKECTSEVQFIEKWDLLMVALGQKLIGNSIDAISTTPSDLESYPIEQDEYEALGAELVEPGHVVFPLFSVPISVHILFSAEEQYPRPGYIPIYLTSTTVPAYVRLHLLSRFLIADSKPDLDAGEGFCMAVMRIIEGEWAIIEDNGSPDMSMVLQHIIPRPERFLAEAEGDGDQVVNNPTFQAKQRRGGPKDRRTDAEIKRDFESIQQSSKVRSFI